MKIKNYYYKTIDGVIFDTPKECRDYYKYVMKEDGVRANKFKGARYHYTKKYYDIDKTIFYRTNGIYSVVVNL